MKTENTKIKKDKNYNSSGTDIKLSIFINTNMRADL